jgi:5-methyltetrahydropteroyltriglutamate--homocysteine methyltransferase
MRDKYRAIPPDYRKYVTLRIEAPNDAIAGIVDIALKVKAQTYSFEAANLQDRHGLQVWKETKLAPGTILMPGVASQTTSIVAHPELIARPPRRLGWHCRAENVVGRADCGIGGRVHAGIGWTKLLTLAEGAAPASKTLRHRRATVL